MFASNGILFNHESPLRGETFVTRKITRAAARIKLGLQQRLYLGNLNATRDWGFAGDYVRAMWMMLQADSPGDFVISTGEAHSVREFTERAFAELAIRLSWRGSGKDEMGIDTTTGTPIVHIDPRYYRPAEVDHLLGDSSKARTLLGWQPTVRFDDLVTMMVQADLDFARRELTLKNAGYSIRGHHE